MSFRQTKENRFHRVAGEYQRRRWVHAKAFIYSALLIFQNGPSIASIEPDMYTGSVYHDTVEAVNVKADVKPVLHESGIDA
jgi:hypothetical protein